MYGLVIKTSFGIWRLSFMSPPLQGRETYCFCHGRLSVCLSITKPCPLCYLKTVQDILQRNIKTILTFKCLIEHLLADFLYSRPLDTYL